MASMGTMTAGYSSVDFITANMVPLTLSHFTKSATLIACIIDLNKLFGFLMQPYVAWKSDRITRFGRRRPWLFLGIPSTGMFLLVLGLLPFLIVGDSRHTWIALAILILVNVGLQACQDINWGADGPLYGDSFRKNQLGSAATYKLITSKLMELLMLNVAMRAADSSEFYPYAISGGLLAVSLIIAVFVIKEYFVRGKDDQTGKTSPSLKEKYKPLQHLGLLKTNPHFRRAAIIGAAALTYPAVFGLFNSLFAVKTLGMSKTEFGQAMSWGPLIQLALAWPTGEIIDRFGPRKLVFWGFLICILSSAAIVFWVDSVTSLAVVCAFKAIGQGFVGMSMMAVVFQHATKEESGKIYGLVQFVRAFTAFSFTPLVGVAVDISGTYRAGYVMASGIALVGMVFAFGLDPKWDGRKSISKAESN
jgi:Na+/melibiose symporter-like transporter